MTELPSRLPEVLEPLKISAPYLAKGGDRTTLSLVQYPAVGIEESDEKNEILSTWKEWWSRTPWAKDPLSRDPRWGSSSRTGHIWITFGEAADASSGYPYVFCLNCSYALQHPTPKGIGTKHLHNHLKTQSCQLVSSPVHDQLSNFLRQTILPPMTNIPRPIPTYSLEALEKELVRVVVDNCWSFRTVERPSFQRFLRFLQPSTVVVSRYKFESIFQHQFEKASAELLNDLSQGTKISIALDAWSANNHLSFLAIKGYYINTHWQLKEKLLDFIPIRGKHTGTSMAEEVFRVLSSTGTQRRLLAITCDNASNNSTLAQAVQIRLQEESISWSPSENTIPCLAHIINLVVQDIIQHLRLAPSAKDDAGQGLQRCQVNEIRPQISVPNSLRKACTLLL